MKYIILRIDDLGKINNNIIFEKMLLYLKECNINVTMGLIPCYLKTNDQILNLWNIDNRNEIALHGYKHKKYNNVPEFSKIKYFRAVRLLKRSKKLIYKYLKIIPTTFIPPYNKISNQTILTSTPFPLFSPKSGPASLKTSQAQTQASRSHYNERRK